MGTPLLGEADCGRQHLREGEGPVLLEQERHAGHHARRAGGEPADP